MKTGLKHSAGSSDPDTDSSVSDTETTEIQKGNPESRSLLDRSSVQDQKEPEYKHEKDELDNTNNDAKEEGHDDEKGDSSDKDNDKDESFLKAPDGGYGWLVVFGMFLNQMIYGGMNRSAGIFYLQFKSKFDTSAQVGAWPWALMSTTTFLMGPLCGAFTMRYSVRTAYMIGTTIVVVCFIIDGFAPNIYVLFASHTILGIGRGLQSPLLIVNLYFDKHRSRAVGIGSAGVGVGSFWMAPLCQFLFDFYGFQGAFLVVAGMALNGLVCAMLFRPLSMYHRFTNVRRKKKAKSQAMEEGEAEPNKEAITHSKTKHNNRKSDIELTNFNVPQQNGVNNTENHLSTKPSTQRRKPDNCIKSSLKICFPIEHKEKQESKKTQAFHWHLLKDIPLLMFCFGTLFFMVTFKSAFTFLPAIALDKGLSDYESALVLTVFGAMDTVGRISVGLVMDTNRLRRFRPYFFQLFLFMMAAASLVIPSLESFLSFCFVCAVYGFMTGAFVSQRMVVLTDITGREYMSSSLGIQKCFQAVGSLVGPPISGALRDELGNYDTSFYLGGGSMLGSVLLYSLCIFLQIRRKKRSQ